MTAIAKNVEVMVTEMRQVIVCDGCRMETQVGFSESIPDGWIYIKPHHSHEHPTGSVSSMLHACSPHCGMEVMRGLARLKVTA